ncbi:MAG: DUF975 family protein [Clostridia bacterium]|nr:DUF975 family protein [Clostridia bacterium]
MFNRSLLKANAKSALKGNLLIAILACLLWALIANALTGINAASIKYSDLFDSLDYSSTGDFIESIYENAEEIGKSGSAVGGPVSFVYNILVTNIVNIGLCFFFLRNRHSDTNLSNLFAGYKNGLSVNIVTMLLRTIFIALWSLLFVIPGIVKMYEYSMIPYILADNPGISRKDAFALSKKMTNGNKGKLFVLDLSFIGWGLLCCLTAGIGFVFLAPYVNATRAETYEYLKANTPV